MAGGEKGGGRGVRGGKSVKGEAERGWGNGRREMGEGKSNREQRNNA